MKQQVLKIIKSKLAGAEDDLLRSGNQFNKMSNRELNKEYGSSGKTCSEIYTQYKENCDELNRCIAWVESAL